MPYIRVLYRLYLLENLVKPPIHKNHKKNHTR
nr:MAG TPA: hypothetical protein [Caudoviricetes sp.]